MSHYRFGETWEERVERERDEAENGPEYETDLLCRGARWSDPSDIPALKSARLKDSDYWEERKRCEEEDRIFDQSSCNR